MKSLVIANSGTASSGKSTSVKEVWYELKKKYPSSAKELLTGGDIKGVVEIKGVKVGVESQGDPNSRMFESIDEFLEMGCEIIVVACRTSGATHDKVDSLRAKLGWDLMWCSHTKYHSANSSNVRADLNHRYAEQVVKLIEDRIEGII